MKKVFLSFTLFLWCFISFSQTLISTDSTYYDVKGKKEMIIFKIENGKVKYATILRTGDQAVYGSLRTTTQRKFSSKYRTKYQWDNGLSFAVSNSQDNYRESGHKANLAANGLYGAGYGLLITGSLLSATGGGSIMGVPMVIGGSVCLFIGFINARVGATNASRQVLLLMDERKK